MSKLFMRAADIFYGFNPTNVLKDIEESQFWPQKKLDELQIEYLRRLLMHVGANVPFYRNWFKKASFDPAKVESIEDIQCMPVMDKFQIIKNQKFLISDKAPRPRIWLRTTGTTGQPLSFLRTRIAQSYKIASRVRFRRWYGVERDTPLLNVGGISSHDSNLRDKIRHSIHFMATRRFEVFSSDLEGDGKERAALLIEKHRLDAVMGYPSGIARLAQYLAEGRKLVYQPKAVFTNSETLTELIRKRIRKGFGVEPRADYVATEGSIAHECPNGKLHVDMEGTLIELLPCNNENGFREVVITSLHSFDFPLIRYRLGDLAQWAAKPCSCGRGLKTLDSLLGRSSDGIIMPDGRVFTAANINMRIAHFPFIDCIRQYQIVQHDGETLELRILDAPETDDDTIETFRAALNDLFRGMVVEARRMPELPRGAAGKFSPVIGLKRDVNGKLQNQ